MVGSSRKAVALAVQDGHAWRFFVIAPFASDNKEVGQNVGRQVEWERQVV